MLHERLLGVLCLGAATLAATWGGNGALDQAAARAARDGGPALHADTVLPGLTSPDTGPAPAVDPSGTATTAAPVASTTGPGSGSASATTGPAAEPPDVVGKRALLTQADVPAGFTMTIPAPADKAAPPDTPFERCAGSDAGRLTAAVGARARSATFAKADTGSVSSVAVVFDEPATAEKVLGLMTTSAARACFEDLLNARLARNPKLSQDVKGFLGPAPSPGVGEGSLAYRFDVRLPAEDVEANARPDDPPVRFVADFLMIRKGRTLLLAEFGNLRQPWVDATLKSVAANLVAHA